MSHSTKLKIRCPPLQDTPSRPYGAFQPGLSQCPQKGTTQALGGGARKSRGVGEHASNSGGARTSCAGGAHVWSPLLVSAPANQYLTFSMTGSAGKKPCICFNSLPSSKRINVGSPPTANLVIRAGYSSESICERQRHRDARVEQPGLRKPRNCF